MSSSFVHYRSLFFVRPILLLLLACSIHYRFRNMCPYASPSEAQNFSSAKLRLFFSHRPSLADAQTATRKFYLIITIMITVMIIQFRICRLCLGLHMLLRWMARGRDFVFTPHRTWFVCKYHIETKEINKTKIQRTCKFPNNFRVLFSFPSHSSSAPSTFL